MKKFTCRYLKENGHVDSEAPVEKIEATSAEKAAHIFAEQHPSNHPTIWVNWGLAGAQVVDNPEWLVQREKDTAARVEREEAATAARKKSLQELLATVENTNGNLADLSYADLTTLIENMRDFPGIRDELSPEECAVREKLYMIAFFDKNLQAGLQAMTSRHPRFSPQSGKSPQPSSTRGSEVSEIVSYLERLHYWIRFMGVVLLIQIILAVILMFFLGVAD